MKTKKEIEDKIKEIESDERLGYPPAQIQTNAPLSLVQTELESKLRALKWVLQ